MNVVFRLADVSCESALRRSIEESGFAGLDGHRSLGGWRASLYNAVSRQATRDLADLLGWWAAAR